MTGFLLHADVDSFYASVEMRSRPELRAVPMAVVAHVFIASANYPARDRGVKGGMSVRDARRACPELVLIDVDRPVMERVSEDLFDLFAEVALVVEPGSMEEGFLDVGAGSLDEALACARRLRASVQKRLGITVSVGVARTKLMAKLASRRAKPDGVSAIEPDEEARLRESLPIEDLWGVGKQTRARLRELGVETLGGIDHVQRDVLFAQCGAAMARRLVGFREGSDDAVLRPLRARTSMSAEVTTAGYNRPDWTPGEMLSICVRRACHRAHRAGLAATGAKLSLFLPDGAKNLVRECSDEFPSIDAEHWLARCQSIAPRPAPRLLGLRITLTGLAPSSGLVENLSESGGAE